MVQCPILKNQYTKIRPDFLIYSVSKINYWRFIRARCCSQLDKEYSKEGKLQNKIQETFWCLNDIKAIFTVKMAKESWILFWRPSKAQNLPGAWLLLREFVISLKTKNSKFHWKHTVLEQSSPHLELTSKNTASGFSNEEAITKLQGWKGYWEVI